jgi:hypothetical protein
MEGLPEVVSESPVPRHLHIVVRVSPAGECEQLSRLITLHGFMESIAEREEKFYFVMANKPPLRPITDLTLIQYFDRSE